MLTSNIVDYFEENFGKQITLPAELFESVVEKDNPGILVDIMSILLKSSRGHCLIFSDEEENESFYRTESMLIAKKLMETFQVDENSETKESMGSTPKRKIIPVDVDLIISKSLTSSERSLREFLSYVIDNDNNVVLFVDKFYLLSKEVFFSKNYPSYLRNLFYNAINRNRIQLLGYLSLKEFIELFNDEKKKYNSEYFEGVSIKNTEIEQKMLILLKEIKKIYEKRYSISMDDSCVDEVFTSVKNLKEFSKDPFARMNTMLEYKFL
ncbi:MAG: hypothetical protein QXD54_05540, partial [Candidatus Aenigmatarchaeota archaeon]